MRRILITNDDGIASDGLRRLAEAALDFGEVYVVAPDAQRSAASHSITLREPLILHPRDFPVEGVRGFSCSGTPADCVRVGSLGLMEEKPDVYMNRMEQIVADDFPYDKIIGGKSYAWGKFRFPEPFYEIDERIIWGLTARITMQMIHVINSNYHPEERNE